MTDPRTVATDLTRQLKEAFGDRLRSVVLFGSVARGEAIPGVSDVNLLVLLDRVTQGEVADAAPLAVRWVRRGNAPPIMFSLDEWDGMSDTFAIEISDMLEAREVVHGPDPLVGVELDPGELRLHAEREIRDILLQFRLRMLLAAGDPLELGTLMLSGIPSFSAYMRAALRLSGETPPGDTESVMARSAELIGADAGPMLECLNARRASRLLRVSLDSPLLESYLAFVRSLAAYLDRLPLEPRGGGPNGTSSIERPDEKSISV